MLILEEDDGFSPFAPAEAVVYYRLEDSPYAGHEPRTLKFYRVRKTARGAWVVASWAYYRRAEPLETCSATVLREQFGARLVLDGKGRRYCYPDLGDARESYRIRKVRQIQHARNGIEHAEAALHWLEHGELPCKRCWNYNVDTPITAA